MEELVLEDQCLLDIDGGSVAAWLGVGAGAATALQCLGGGGAAGGPLAWAGCAGLGVAVGVATWVLATPSP